MDLDYLNYQTLSYIYFAILVIILYLSVYATLEKVIFLCTDWLNMRTAPFQTRLGVGSGQTDTPLTRAPVGGGNHLSEGILRALGLFRASQGLAEANRVGQGVHL